MPLNVRRLSASVVLVLIIIVGVLAQTPTSGDVMRARVSKAKAFVAVKNYAAAIYELEGIKRETNDASVNGVVQVMLMNCYLESLDYKRGNALLSEVYTAQKTNKPNSNYFAVAGQVVRGAKNQSDRYKSLGLSVSDRNLPAEAIADVDKMRELVENVVQHSKILGDNKKLTPDSMALLEEASNARGSLARDEYDARRWKEEVADARERVSSSRTTIINTVEDGLPKTMDANQTLATNSAPMTAQNSPSKTQIIPVSKIETPKIDTRPKKVETPNNNETVAKKVELEVKSTPKVEITSSLPTDTVAKTETFEQPKIEPTKEEVKESITNTAQQTPEKPAVIQEPKTETVAETVQPPTVPTPQVDNTPRDSSPIQVGSLIDYATAKVAPTYPPTARTMRMTGTVKVEVLLNEDGSIAEVQKTSGPSMLQRAATDALKRWKFKPFLRDGQPVKATGFVSFNFSL